jgi:hypothetical protein
MVKAERPMTQMQSEDQRGSLCEARKGMSAIAKTFRPAPKRGNAFRLEGAKVKRWIRT